MRGRRPGDWRGEAALQVEKPGQSVIFQVLEPALWWPPGPWTASGAAGGAKWRGPASS
ncbi:MAG TPA: hypothetical protein VHN80_27355 [Kineosporiaceae bacterium]|nr:hypothetical protein [Kineosporiaceae bacterium]